MPGKSTLSITKYYISTLIVALLKALNYKIFTMNNRKENRIEIERKGCIHKMECYAATEKNTL